MEFFLNLEVVRTELKYGHFWTHVASLSSHSSSHTVCQFPWYSILTMPPMPEYGPSVRCDKNGTLTCTGKSSRRQVFFCKNPMWYNNYDCYWIMTHSRRWSLSHLEKIWMKYEAQDYTCNIKLIKEAKDNTEVIHELTNEGRWRWEP